MKYIFCLFCSKNICSRAYLNGGFCWRHAIFGYIQSPGETNTTVSHKVYLRSGQRGHTSGRVGRTGEWPAAAGGSVWCFCSAHSLRRANWESPSGEAEGTLRTLHGLLEGGAMSENDEMNRCFS